MNSDNRNAIIVLVIFAILFGAYEMFFVRPAQERVEAARKRDVAAHSQSAPEVASATFLNRAQGLATSPRIQVRTGALQGSISLTGARFDDLFLNHYKASLDKGAPPVELLRPSGTRDAYFVSVGWTGDNLPGLPGAQTVWTQTGGGVLSAGHPVSLRYVTPGGLIFDRTIAIDDKYMFTVTDTVTNHSPASISLKPRGAVQRDEIPAGLGANNIVHEGGIAMLNRQLEEEKYQKWKKEGGRVLLPRTGWMGITDKYWMSILIPPASEPITTHFETGTPEGVNVYIAYYDGGPIAIAPGAARSYTTRLFAGPKDVGILTGYRDAAPGVPRFDDAVDWGHLIFITKPMYWLMDYFHRHVTIFGRPDPVTGQLLGNVGIAILLLTLSIRLITFPAALPAYEMSVKMRRVQPLMKELQEKYKEDPQTLQKETMALYQREKVNPVLGCVPQLLTIPILYALTKLFTVTILIWHAPFFGWVQDLSGRDPTTFVNLFGLIPWNPATTPLIGGFLDGALHIGAWPLAYGIVTWLSMSMTPTTGMDPTQQSIMKLMPLVFTFILAQYTVGLLIYWTFSGVFTIVQQYVLMRRYKTPNPIDNFFRRLQGKEPLA